jgi:hypothetical protein
MERMNAPGGPKHILHKKDIPSSLDSANAIYAALIFLSSDVDLNQNQNENENEGTISDKDVRKHSSLYHDLFPQLPILKKNPVRGSPPLENIYPSAFALSTDARQYIAEDDGLTPTIQSPYREKLHRLESYYMRSTSHYPEGFVGDVEYLSRIRVIPRSWKGDREEAVREEESCLTLGEVKRITRKRRKVEKAGPADAATASATSAGKGKHAKSSKTKSKSKSKMKMNPTAVKKEEEES